MECHPKPYSNILYCTSWIYYFAMIVGLYHEIYDLSLYTGAVWLTSINFWRDPDLSWRYYLDIIVVRSGILYHLIRGFDCNNYNSNGNDIDSNTQPSPKNKKQQI